VDIGPLASLTGGYGDCLLDDLMKLDADPRASASTRTLAGWRVRVEVSLRPGACPRPETRRPY
jgi:hypothetical protein